MFCIILENCFIYFFLCGYIKLIVNMHVDMLSFIIKQHFYILLPGTVRNLGPDLWKLQHLTSLYLNLNNITRIPPEINRLTMLTYLDLSSNKLRSLPSELGDLSQLRELLLYNNLLRMLPFELGKLFNLQNLGNDHVLL